MVQVNRPSTRAVRHAILALMTLGSERVLHLVRSEWNGDVPYLVSSATLAEAERATADDAPRPPMNFGDVRRSGDVDELEHLLSEYGGASPEHYVSAIERAAGRSPAAGDVVTRLKALHDCKFDGDDTATDDYECVPGDDVDFREERIAWDEPEVRYWDVIAGATARDLPSDLVAEYCINSYATGSPGSSGSFIDSSVDPQRLVDLVAQLEARGYTIHR